MKLRFGDVFVIVVVAILLVIHNWGIQKRLDNLELKTGVQMTIEEWKRYELLKED